jgi:hypothetical protein
VTQLEDTADTFTPANGGHSLGGAQFEHREDHGLICTRRTVALQTAPRSRGRRSRSPSESNRLLPLEHAQAPSSVDSQPLGTKNRTKMGAPCGPVLGEARHRKQQRSAGPKYEPRQGSRGPSLDLSGPHRPRNLLGSSLTCPELRARCITPPKWALNQR